MTLLEFTGCSLLGFGPTLSMFVLTVAGQPSRVIVFLTGSFFWLLSLLLASLAWLLLECFRLLFFRVLRKAERVLNAVVLTGAENAMRSRLAFAYTAGLAFGAMSALFSLLGQLTDALGPGTASIFGGTPRRLTVVAITAGTFSVLHVFWALVSFHALDSRRMVNARLRASRSRGRISGGAVHTRRRIRHLRGRPLCCPGGVRGDGVPRGGRQH
ncbi:hypothetical protein MRX96_030601 [Rhipicephalus microplus]